MLKVKYNTKGEETVMQYEIDEKLEEILKKYNSKMTINSEYYIYNGNNIKKENNFEKIINYVNDANEKNKNIIELKEIFCPECNEKVIIKINDYKLEMKCINNHNNILSLKDYIEKIGISKIKCNDCNKNKYDTPNNEFYICLICNINLCPVCKSTHDKNHNIINYDDKNYICNKHNENYIKYCCNKNICKECENEHKDHNNINYEDILPNINDDIKVYIDKLKKEIDDIKNKLNNIIDNIDIYYNIYNNIINNYKKDKKNYEMIQNINEFINYNKIIKKNIEQISNSKDINIKFQNIMKIFNKNNINNYIIGEFEIKERNEEIRIINSYEQYMTEAKMEIEDNYKNEEEIKENIEIIINDKNIPFTYFYKFEEKGKYKIKYAFKKNLTKIGFMFSKCSSLKNIDLSYFNSQNVNFTGYMFGECSSLNNINLNNFNTQNVTEMWCMFRECSSLIYLDLSNFNTQNVTNMNFMFFGCSSLKSLDLSNFNTQNVTTMFNMFNGCSSLNNLNLSNFDTQKVTNMGNIFMGCSSLKKIIS